MESKSPEEKQESKKKGPVTSQTGREEEQFEHLTINNNPILLKFQGKKIIKTYNGLLD